MFTSSIASTIDFKRNILLGRAVSNQCTGLMEWTTGMDFDLFFPR